ncbi:MAG: MOSC domain-containing protein [Caulobacterales bacterium]
MAATVTSLYRHPIKGFTPELLDAAELRAGQSFPGDRLYAVEDGPSGFDPAAPGFIPKQKFTVLAKIAEVAQARTRLDDATGVLRATAEGLEPFAGKLSEADGKAAFAAWLTRLLGAEASGPLRVLDGAGHRFLDHPLGHVSIVSLASVRDLAQRLGRPVDPLRFRANLYVDGWPAWAENDWEGREVRIGPEIGAKVFKPIVRCAAPGVDPVTAIRDMDIPAELHRLYGHTLCGVYVQVTAGGTVRAGDEVRV